MLLGVHVSIADNVAESPGRAGRLGCNIMQIFSRNPQQWKRSSLAAADCDSFAEQRRKARIERVFVHIPYLLNLASPDRILLRISLKAFIEDLRDAHKLGAEYLVTHMGSHKKTTEKEGIKRLTASLNSAIKKTKDTPIKILLENTSGSGSWLGYDFAHQEKVLSGIEQKERLGFCLDTAHAYAAGNDISNEKGLQEFLDKIETQVGLKNIELVHLNDTSEKLGSRFDRHQHIGKGRIGEKGIGAVINHPCLRELPFILETPKKTIEDDQMNLAKVRSLRQGE